MFIAILLIVLTVMSLVLIPKYGAYRCSRILHCCKGVPYTDSSQRGYSDIVHAMERLHTNPDKRGFTDYDKLEHHMICDICHGFASYGAMSFIRMCHMAGIEIVIRPVNSEVKDLERDSEEMRKRMRVLRKKYLRANGLKTNK